MYRATRLALLAAVACSLTVAAYAGHEGHEGHGGDEHAAHQKMMMSPPATKIVQADYTIPDVTLVDASGHAARLQDVVGNDEPLVVNFIFTTCTTICPVITSTTLQLQKQLKDDSVRPKFVSISIDPDYDTATVLHDYAENYGADWTFLTGAPNDVLTALQAFDAYRGNKVNHFALTLMRAPGESEWTRVEGLTSATELARIWRSVVL